MFKEMFDEIDENELIDDLEGYEEFETEAEDLDEDDEIIEKKPKRSHTFADYDEDLDADEKRRLMSLGMDLP